MAAGMVDPLAVDQVETGDALLIKEPRASRVAPASAAAALPRASLDAEAAFDPRRRAAASAVAVLFGCIVSALAVALLRSGVGEAGSPTIATDAVTELWGFGGGAVGGGMVISNGACVAKGCDCDCAWAAEPDACLPRADDGNCCSSCCCGDSVDAALGVGFEAEVGGGVDMYPASSLYPEEPQGQQPDQLEAPRSFAAHEPNYGEHYMHHHHRFSVVTMMWIVLFVGVCVLTCVAIYLLNKK